MTAASEAMVIARAIPAPEFSSVLGTSAWRGESVRDRHRLGWRRRGRLSAPLRSVSWRRAPMQLLLTRARRQALGDALATQSSQVAPKLLCLACFRAKVVALSAHLPRRSDCQEAAVPLCRLPAMSRRSILTTERQHRDCLQSFEIPDWRHAVLSFSLRQGLREHRPEQP